MSRDIVDQDRGGRAAFVAKERRAGAGDFFALRLSADGRIRGKVRGTEVALGLEAEAIEGRVLWEVVTDEARDVLRRGAQEALDGLSAVLCEVALGGRLYEVTLTPWRLEDGDSVELTVTGWDVGEAKESLQRAAQEHRLVEEALVESLGLLEGAIESTADGIMVADMRGRMVRFNRKFATMWRLPEAVLTSASDADALEIALAQLCDPDEFFRVVRELYEHPEVSQFDTLRFKDGRVFERYSQPQRRGKEIVGRVWSFRDVTARHRAEEALRTSEEALRRLGDNLPDGMVYQLVGEIGGHRRFVYVSAGVERIHGVTAQQVMQDATILYNQILEEDRILMMKQELESVNGSGVFSVEVRIRTARGDLKWIFLHSAPARAADGSLMWDGLELDITQRKQLEERLRQSQKMEGIGHLAGGLAHEFNNILVAMMMNLNLVRISELEVADRGLLEEVQELARKAAELIKQLLAFGRQSVMRLEAHDLGVVTAKQCRMLERVLGPSIELRLVVEPRMSPVRMDVGMIEQVILNLCLNARDAMDGKGVLSIGVETVEVGGAEAGAHDCARPGRHARMRFTDTGSGIEAPVLGRLFEPFFTTKEVGRGTGLGLATVRGIVEQHRGWVEVETRVGKGTTFTVFLPLAAEELGAGLGLSGKPSSRRGRVLVVDAMASIRRPTRAILEREGYEVVEAADGREALAIWGSRGGDIDLIYTDVMNASEITGSALADRLTSEKPGVGVIVAGAHFSAGVDGAAEMRSGRMYLAKPCPASTLLSTIERCLEHARGGVKLGKERADRV